YMGTPVQMYDSEGNKTWDCTLDIYGKVTDFRGESLHDCPFRFQGQYEDIETGLYYNRFRYYDPNLGGYISQDPIGLLGGKQFYSYVHDLNLWIDILGLRGKESYPSWMKPKENYERHHIIPYEYRNHEIFTITKMNINNATNMVYLPRKESIHSTKAIHVGFYINGQHHSKYNKAMLLELNRLMDDYKTNKWSVERLQKELLELQHITRKRLNNARIQHH
ncbi:RHS repeat-associated core domain-containing protein, partial [Bacteroides eggerthii]